MNGIALELSAVLAALYVIGCWIGWLRKCDN